jgi:hypothetical protein
VNLTSELKNPLGGGGLSSINVCEDADVPVFAEINHDVMSREGSRFMPAVGLLSSLERDFFTFFSSF